MENQIIRTFGRRHGKSLSARKQWLVDNILPAISPKFIKKAGKSVILEIGFGAGEHLRELAHNHPDDIIIGAEPFINGVASLLSSITNESDNRIKPEYNNIYVWPDDVRDLLSDNESPTTGHQNINFEKIYILHPDPWPKARHEKRRLLNSEFLNLLATHLAPGGEIIIGTDHYEYFDWIVNQVKDTKLRIAGHRLPIIETRYMQKNKAGTTAPKYLVLSDK